MEPTVIHETEKFNVVEVDGKVGIQPIDPHVAVLPFERGEDGLPSIVGVLNEYNPLRRGAKSTTVITGAAEGDDPDILSAAKRELTEEAGYDAIDTSRWTYLGEMTTSKLVMEGIHCFAVDVTGLRRSEPKGDGSLDEAKSEFKKISVSDALDVEDCFIPAIFMRCFRFIFNGEIRGAAADLAAPKEESRLTDVPIEKEKKEGGRVKGSAGDIGPGIDGEVGPSKE